MSELEMSKITCRKCGSPDIYMSWDNMDLCQICFDDLYADAKLVQKELAKERFEE
jgi:ribosomal protein S14